jgi:hypothetical protein
VTLYPQAQGKLAVEFLWSLLGRSNPTRRWKEDRSVPLVVDLDRHRLADVGIGERFERLAFLGPADCDGDLLSFRSRGVEVVTEGGVVVEFTVFLRPPSEDEQMGRFAGSFRYRGAPLALSQGTREREVVAVFGAPYWRDQDEDEVLLFYEFGEWEWGIELSLAGWLKAVVVGKPLLADAETRAAYGVDKPWPPR